MRKYNRYTWGIIAAATVATAAIVMPAGAVTMDWDDLTDAQQENAYKALESENESLKARIRELEGQLGLSGGSSGGETATDTSQSASVSDSSDGAQDTSTYDDASNAAGEAQSYAVRSIDGFLSDLAASFEARQEIARTYTNEQVSAMSDADMWAFRFQCAEAERSFYDSYSQAQFDDLNVFYLCSEYCGGLGKQFRAKEVWNSTGNGDEANKLYTAGYYNRAYALVELCEYYGLGPQRGRDQKLIRGPCGCQEGPGTAEQHRFPVRDAGRHCRPPDSKLHREVPGHVWVRTCRRDHR